MRTTSVKTQAFEGVFTSILLIVIFVLTFSVLSMGNPANFGRTVRNAFESLEVCPDEDALSFEDIPTDQAALRAYAADLFLLGGTNAKNADAMAAYCACVMKMTVMNIENYVDIDAAIVKTQTEYFRTDYRLELDLPFKDMLGEEIAAGFEMVLAERMYASTSSDRMVYQKVRNSSRGENNIPSANWNDIYLEEERDLPVFNSTQDGVFEVVAYDISAATISSATVEKVLDEASGHSYYVVKMILDAGNPELTPRIINTIREGSSDPGAHYTKITYDFELWDNGYFKSLDFVETWSAKALGLIAFQTISDYAWQFSYDPADADPDAYADCKAMKNSLEIEN